MFAACSGASDVASRPVSGGALRPSNRLAAMLAIALAAAIGSVPVATVIALYAVSGEAR
jgi:hypothetical protein